ncbi:TIGR03792 family protein [Oscillatoria sp. FACHB-1407]|uniref:TIGR03792 family protein n=1 Tax=Oscillatoria sp. FACHB-1407 TaxID=2692847 RepID=UPI001682F5ED|nr:TIGR03792 family protein [Oscillatoria sp. FACHB-1407]MBD2465291.1 TIGR03792 family protein [Oscillatoria sp. FACHB-1407]
MVVEFLRFTVASELREQFVRLDSDIWTPVLAKTSGFLRKEVWLNSDDPTEVVVVIHWASFEKWQSIPPEDLQKTEEIFSQEMGDTYQLLESKRYQVQTFLQP